MYRVHPYIQLDMAWHTNLYATFVASCPEIARTTTNTYEHTHEFNSLPSMPPGNLIGSPSSRRNVMDGGGEPVAEHLNVTLLPSLTTISVLNIHQNDKAHSFTN